MIHMQKFVSNVVKNRNTTEIKCRFDASVCNNKQQRNKDKCRGVNVKN